MKYTTAEDFNYAVQCRRYLHRYPEVLFDLDNTVTFVRTELNKLGISWGEAGPSSVTAWIGPEKAPITIGIRADMDALPVQEKTDVEFISEIPGRMHACGHDAHTGILLAVARILKRYENDMSIRVKLLFQPSEEGETSGAKSMVEHGAVDDVDFVMCTHADNNLDFGLIGCRAGNYMSACNPITITFKGKTAHATIPEQGIDAVAMAWEAYGELKQIAATEAGENTVYIFGINYLHGGTAHNVVSDRCELKISFRYYDMDFAERVEKKCIAKCREIATRFGGEVDVNWYMSAPPVYNDPDLIAQFATSVKKSLPGKLVEIPMQKTTEDFSWFLQRKPGFLFRFGTRNEAEGCIASLHSNDFKIDERGMESAIESVVAFVLEHN